MFTDENTRQQTISHAARGHEGSLRQVLDDLNERLKAVEEGGQGQANGNVMTTSEFTDRLLAIEKAFAQKPSVGELAAPAPAEVPLDEKIKIAIRALPEDGYGANGKPNVAAIEAALGESITAADRDRVWSAMQEDAE